MDPRVPASIRGLLTDYLVKLEKTFNDQIVGVYLHGSIALNAFDSESDIDFSVAMDHELNCEELVLLMDLHGELLEKYPNKVMQGTYFKWERKKDVSRIDFETIHEGVSKEPLSAPYFDGFTMTASIQERMNPITWWILKKQGISLRGPDVDEIPVVVDPKRLVNYVYDNMQDYWKHRVERFWQTVRHEKLISQFEIDSEVVWTVLGLLRQWVTLKDEQIVSKLDAGSYGLKSLPEMYHPIIKEAMRLRKKEKTTYYASNEGKLEDTYKLSHYIFEWADLQQNVYN